MYTLCIMWVHMSYPISRHLRVRTIGIGICLLHTYHIPCYIKRNKDNDGKQKHRFRRGAMRGLIEAHSKGL